MSDLNDKLLEIKRQKDEYILPENLKKDVIVYGVTGTLEPGSGGVKLFDTIEEMQEDESAQDGDLAVAYSMSSEGLKSNSVFNQLILADKVVLPEVPPSTGHSSLHIDFESDNSDLMGCYANLHNWLEQGMDCGFSFTFMSNKGHLDISYVSTDGINYTISEIRDDYKNIIQDNIASFGLDIKLKDASKPNLSNFWAYFIKFPNYEYSGLCQYRLLTDKKSLGFISGNEIKCSIGSSSGNTCITELQTTYTNTKYISISRAKQLLQNSGETEIYLCKDDTGLYRLDSDFIKGFLYSSDDILNGYFGENIGTYNIYKINDDNTETLVYTTENSDFEQVVVKFGGESSGNTAYKIKNLPFNTYCVISYNGEETYFGKRNIFPMKYVTDGYYGISPDVYNELISDFPYAKYYTYYAVSSSLNATDDDVFGKIYDGKDGISTGTLNNMSNLTKSQLLFRIMKLYQPMQTMTLDNMITDLSNLFYLQGDLYTVPLFDTSNVVNFKAMFVYCNLIVSIPTFDTSKAVNVNRMFEGCTSLVDLPILNTSKIEAGSESWNDGFNRFVNDCPNLSNESLNNVLEMCINAVSYTGTKTLKWVGLSQAQAEICQTLSNYQDFINAGWSTGY